MNFLNKTKTITAVIGGVLGIILTTVVLWEKFIDTTPTISNESELSNALAIVESIQGHARRNNELLKIVKYTAVRNNFDDSLIITEKIDNESLRDNAYMMIINQAIKIGRIKFASNVALKVSSDIKIDLIETFLNKSSLKSSQDINSTYIYDVVTEKTEQPDLANETIPLDAEISLIKKSQASNDSVAMKPGNYTLTITKDGYEEKIIDIKVNADYAQADIPEVSLAPDQIDKNIKQQGIFKKRDQSVRNIESERAFIERAEGVVTLSGKKPEREQFQLAESLYEREQYREAGGVYGEIIKAGASSAFFELAMYKRGWSMFKQGLYKDALEDFIAMLDYKQLQGYDFDQDDNKRMQDTYRAISLCFYYLGGAKYVAEHFEKIGHRMYEPSIYSNLSEYYLDKRRYKDAANAYNVLLERYPTHKDSPYFGIRVIEIYRKGGLVKLVVEAKKKFVSTYGLRSLYWAHFDINEYPAVRSFLKTNLIDLARHFHALYQNKLLKNLKDENSQESLYWYRKFLDDFPDEDEASKVNYQLAGLLLELGNYSDAAIEYEKAAYSYPRFEDSGEAGYAAVYAYREYLKKVPKAEISLVKKEIFRSSFSFVETFPEHKKAVLILSAAADDLYVMKDYEAAIRTGRMLLANFPNAEPKLQRAAWIVVAHALFDSANYKDAEEGYMQALALTGTKDKSRVNLTANLAASIYKQGEKARKLEDHKTASDHFLRIGKVAPTPSIVSVAEYDGAASLMALKQWADAADVLVSFRKNYPKHKLLPEVTKKLAVIYMEDGKSLLAAMELERIEKETDDDDIRREVLIMAAEQYGESGDRSRALKNYQKLLDKFPEPIEKAIEVRHTMAVMYKEHGEHKEYIAQLEQIVKTDSNGGKGRTDRTRYLAAQSALVLVEPLLKEYRNISLVQPLKKSLNKKKKQMAAAIKAYSSLVDYHVGDVTAAATYNLAEIYFDFGHSLMESIRPSNLDEHELEQYELVLEEQAYPFEEKAINVHEKNMELLGVGVYNEWIDRSIARLAELIPTRYNKSEIEITDVLNSSLESQGKTAVRELQSLMNEAVDNMNSGNNEIAMNYLTKATAIDEANPVISNQLALLKRRTGNFEEARKIYEKIVSQHKDFTPAIINLGILCDLYIQDLKCALKQYTNYLAVAPNDDVALWAADIKKR